MLTRIELELKVPIARNGRGVKNIDVKFFFLPQHLIKNKNPQFLGAAPNLFDTTSTVADFEHFFCFFKDFFCQKIIKTS